MIWKLLKWLLTNVSVSVMQTGDLVRVVIKLGARTVLDRTVDIIPGA